MSDKNNMSARGWAEIEKYYRTLLAQDAVEVIQEGEVAAVPAYPGHTHRAFLDRDGNLEKLERIRFS